MGIITLVDGGIYNCNLVLFYSQFWKRGASEVCHLLNKNNKLYTIHYIKWYAMKYNSIQFSTMDPSLMYSKLWMASLRSPVVTWNAKIIWSFDKADTTWNPSVWLRELSKFLILTGHICDLCTLLTSHVWRFHDADLWL